ncbi:hypothetical protein GCM10023216_07650 [Isoptericola chiayiensis]|uniref:LysM domain-containing protein n=1 Tax=Isoptericola chiayiensis TaxID=579446 RepID=A0ABP8Y3S2_9MICO|nr:LysM domain-containing protein [Isoptericola chiayiensis]NOV99274.1 hypothetical protein [Isoptericola chiayiensis]
MRDHTARPLRSTCGLGTCALGAAVALLLLSSRLLAVAPRDLTAARLTGIDRWVELAVLTAGGVAAAWVLVASLVAAACVAVARFGGARGAGARRTVDAALGTWAPAVVRRLARGAVGVGVGTGLALTPMAATAAESPTPAPTPAAVLDLGWQSSAPDGGSGSEHESGATEDRPDRAETVSTPDLVRPAPGGTDGAEPTADTPTSDDKSAVDQSPDDVRPVDVRPARDVADDTYVVVHGDTLWDIAARDLPADAGAADVLREVTRWHETNRDTIGADPDLILPGQVLQTP